MSKTVVVHQPDFMPYLGFFHRFLHADLWVIFDNVQYLPRGWHSRDMIKTQNGASWFKVATVKCPQDTPINQVHLSKTNWREDHLNLFDYNYHKAPYYKEILPYIEELYSYDCEMMMDFNIKSVEMLCNLLDVHIESVMASSLHPEGKSNELLIDVLKKVKADSYLSGTGARDYMIPKLFEEAGINLIWQEFKAPVYPQQYGEFIPNLSSLDILFNCGINKSREILRSC